MKLLIFLIITLPIYAQTISLEELLKFANQNSKAIHIKRANIEIESQNLQYAKSAYYPSLNIAYSYEYTKSLDGVPFGVESVGGATISNGTRIQSSLSAQLNYELYNFGSTNRAVDVASSEVNIKEMELCLQEKQLHQEITNYYASAKKSYIENKFRKKMYDLRKKLYKIKVRLYQAGTYSKIDLGNEAIYLIAIERDVENTYMKYNEAIIKLSQLSFKELQEDVILLDFTPLDSESLKVGSTKTTQEIIIQERIFQKHNEISMFIRKQLPSFGLYSSYYLYASDPKNYDVAFKDIKQKSWNIGLSVRFNVFDGFKNSSKHQRLKLELKKLNLEHEQEEHNHDFELKSKNNKIKELEYLKIHEQYLVDKNQKNLSMLNKLFEAKKIDKLTLLNSKYELLERNLNIEVKNIEIALEKKLLSIENKGINECFQH